MIDGDLLRLVTQGALGPVVAVVLVAGATFAACWISHDRRHEVETLMATYERAIEKFDLPSALGALRSQAGPPAMLGRLRSSSRLRR